MQGCNDERRVGGEVQKEQNRRNIFHVPQIHDAILFEMVNLFAQEKFELANFFPRFGFKFENAISRKIHYMKLEWTAPTLLEVADISRKWSAESL